METKCKHCDESKGFFRTNGALWCNACGHRKSEQKRPDQSAYERGMSKFFEARK